MKKFHEITRNKVIRVNFIPPESDGTSDYEDSRCEFRSGRPDSPEFESGPKQADDEFVQRWQRAMFGG